MESANEKCSVSKMRPPTDCRHESGQWASQWPVSQTQLTNDAADAHLSVQCGWAATEIRRVTSVSVVLGLSGDDDVLISYRTTNSVRLSGLQYRMPPCCRQHLARTFASPDNAACNVHSLGPITRPTEQNYGDNWLVYLDLSLLKPCLRRVCNSRLISFDLFTWT